MSLPPPGSCAEPSARILIVDDVQANRVALTAVLAPLEQRIVHAASGEDALRRTLVDDFAVVLMDVQMPSLDGFATVQLLRQRERTRYTPVIFVTAFGDVQKAARGYRLGAFDYVTKPFDEEALRARVGALVALYQRGVQVERQAAELRAQAIERERERAARAAAEAANRTKDEFLAVVSHELRTPLNAILGWAEALVAGKLPPDRLQHGLETIARNARIQARLVEDLLEISRIIAGKLTITRAPVDLGAIARRAAETVAPTANMKNVGIELVIEPGDLELDGDAARLQQVVWNLLSNAVKFSPAGAHVELTLARKDERLQLTVSDHGSGIAASFLPHVFDRFRQADVGDTRQHGGLGLGLAIARRIVELHGGTIGVRSDGPGRGATFTLELMARAREDGAPRVPLANDASGPQTGTWRVVTPPVARLDGLRVLFVDDEADARELITMVLADAGAAVRTASSAAEAMQLIASERFDVLVSDIGMPGEDGYSLMRRVMRQGLPLPGIALSAFTSQQDRERALAAGFQTHLAKPLDASKLIAFVHHLAQP